MKKKKQQDKTSLWLPWNFCFNKIKNTKRHGLILISVCCELWKRLHQSFANVFRLYNTANFTVWITQAGGNLTHPLLESNSTNGTTIRNINIVVIFARTVRCATIRMLFLEFKIQHYDWKFQIFHFWPSNSKYEKLATCKPIFQ